MKNYTEFKLVAGTWVEHEVHSSESRRKVMKKLAKSDSLGEQGEKTVVQRKVRLS